MSIRIYSTLCKKHIWTLSKTAEEPELAVLRDTTRLILKYHHIETAAHGIEFYGLFQVHFEIDDLHPK